MIDSLLSHIAPHHCYSCDDSGSVLCDSCIKNITEEQKMICIVCRKIASTQLCVECRKKLPYEHAWYVGEREDLLKELVDGYKFLRKKSSAKVLASLLNEILPELPKETVIVPVPTIAAHKRVRGYGHTELIAQYFAKRRDLVFSEILSRKEVSVQRGATALQRKKQAELAFQVSPNKHVNKDFLHIVIDDVYTTGSTIKEATRCLKNAGVKTVAVALIARQDLDN